MAVIISNASNTSLSVVLTSLSVITPNTSDLLPSIQPPSHFEELLVQIGLLFLGLIHAVFAHYVMNIPVNNYVGMYSVFTFAAVHYNFLMGPLEREYRREFVNLTLFFLMINMWLATMWNLYQHFLVMQAADEALVRAAVPRRNAVRHRSNERGGHLHRD